MGFLQRMSTTVAPARMRAGLDPWNDRYYDIPNGWTAALSNAGVRVNADIALTLSAVWRAVSGITGDISTLPCQILQYLANGGKDRARNHPLAYMLRWQPNAQQTAQQFFGMTVGHQLLRGNAYWEIVAGPRGFAQELIPRHPDRVRKERLPNGRPRYRLTAGGGDTQVRYLTADEMVHVPDLLTFDGWLGASRIAYGTQSVGGMLGAETAAQSFFATGMTAGVVATHKGGELDEDEAKALHGSLARYASGAKNNGGILLIEEDLTIQQLGIEPEKAQLLATRQYGTKEVARWFNYPGHKLEAESQTQAYAAREQANLEYVMGCIRPICIGLEQIIQKDLILDQETFFAEFLIESLFRGDMAAQAAFFTAMIRNRVFNPNEVRLKLNANPYEGGDEYCPWNTASAADNGANGSQQNDTKPAGKSRGAQVSQVRASMLAYEAGQRIVRREIAAVTKLAQKHANDPDGWKSGLQAFYQDHAGFVAETLKVSMPAAREYAAEHGLALANQGVVAMDDWGHVVASELAAWALEGTRTGAGAETTPEHLLMAHTLDTLTTNQRALGAMASALQAQPAPSVTIAEGAIQVDARTTVAPARVDVHPSPISVAAPIVTIAEGAVQVSTPAAPVTIAKGAVQVSLPPPVHVERVTTVERDAQRLISQTRTRDVPVTKEKR
jgi:HK97 family phage portal protein